MSFILKRIGRSTKESIQLPRYS